MNLNFFHWLYSLLHIQSPTPTPKMSKHFSSFYCSLWSIPFTFLVHFSSQNNLKHMLTRSMMNWLCHGCCYEVVVRGKTISFSLECHFSLNTESAQALQLIFMSRVWTVIWYEKNIFLLKENCKSHVLETEWNEDSFCWEVFFCGAITFQGKWWKPFYLGSFKMRFKWSPTKNNLCIHEHCIELGIIFFLLLISEISYQQSFKSQQ